MNYTIIAVDVKKRAVLGCGILPKCGGVHGSKISRDPANITDDFNGCIQSLQCATIAPSVQRITTSWKVRGSSSGGGEIFHTRPDRPCGPPSLLYNEHRFSFPEVKRPRRGADHPAYLAPRLKKVWAILLLPLRDWMACSKVKFTFFIQSLPKQG